MFHFPKGHNTSNRRRFDVDITCIRRKENIDKFPHRFDVFSRCNFDGWKIHVVSTYFFDVILMRGKSTSFQRTLFDVISMSKKSTLFRCSLFDVILMGERSTSFQF